MNPVYRISAAFQLDIEADSVQDAIDRANAWMDKVEEFHEIMFPIKYVKTEAMEED